MMASLSVALWWLLWWWLLRWWASWSSLFLSLINTTMMIMLLLRGCLVYNHLSCWGSSLFSLDPQCDPHITKHWMYYTRTMPKALILYSTHSVTHTSPSTAFLNILYPYNVQFCSAGFLIHYSCKHIVLCLYSTSLGWFVLCASEQASRVSSVTGSKHGIWAFSDSQISNCWLFVSRTYIFLGGLSCPNFMMCCSQLNSFSNRTFGLIHIELIQNCSRCWWQRNGW